jgi:hypothetical protein
MQRLIEEHGLPEDLDKVSVDVTAYRGGKESDEAGEGPEEAAALALCYVAKATCIIESLLNSGADIAHSSLTSVESCKARARQLRQLLLRSLAVNHPRTFFQAVCFVLQVEGLSRSTGKKDMLANKEFAITEVSLCLTSSCEALRKRRDVNLSADISADDDDLRAACAPLCNACLQHICQQLLQYDGKRQESSISLHVVLWRFLEGLCQFSAKVAPKAILDFCLPTAARCLQDVVAAGKKAVDVRDAVACCLCLHTTVEELGRAVLPCLAKVLPPLLDLVGRSDPSGLPSLDGDAHLDSMLLETSALNVVKAFVKTVGPFMSPYLDRILLVVVAPAAPQRVQLLRDLGKEMVGAVPHRLLLPALQSGASAAAERARLDA